MTKLDTAQILSWARYAGRAAADPSTPEADRPKWQERAELASRIAKSGGTDQDAIRRMNALLDSN